MLLRDSIWEAGRAATEGVELFYLEEFIGGERMQKQAEGENPKRILAAQEIPDAATERVLAS